MMRIEARHDRRRLDLHDRNGKTVLPAGQLADRRKQEVEELLDTLGIAHRQTIRRGRALTIPRTPLIVVAILTGLAIVALLARKADHADLVTMRWCLGPASYDWSGFHRVAPRMPRVGAIDLPGTMRHA